MVQIPGLFSDRNVERFGHDRVLVGHTRDALQWHSLESARNIQVDGQFIFRQRNQPKEGIAIDGDGKVSAGIQDIH
ncbi:MAG: hypothetical protein KDK37_17670 [Leptospiraceae bacterium]|nr:hypothetical protein [Leptospiraceae bacterium]